MLCQKEKSVVFYLKSKGFILFICHLKTSWRFWGVPWMRTLPYLHSKDTPDHQIKFGGMFQTLLCFCTSLAESFSFCWFPKFLIGLQLPSSMWGASIPHFPLWGVAGCSREHQQTKRAERSRVSQRLMQTLLPDNENYSVDRDYTFKHWPYAIQVGLRCSCIKGCSTLSMESFLGC